MYAVATFLVVAALTLTFTKLAAGALVATGTPPEVAAFQARSAFSGAGFTTTEAENVINHPTRRRIIAATMFVGNLGTPTLVVTVLVGFLASGPGSTTQRTLVIVAGVLIVVLALANRPVTRWLQGVGERYAQRRLLPALEAELDELLVLGDGFVVAGRRVDVETAETPRSLRGLDQALPGCTVLGVHHRGRFVGESPVDLDLDVGDVIVVYGLRDRIVDPAST